MKICIVLRRFKLKGSPSGKSQALNPQPWVLIPVLFCFELDREGTDIGTNACCEAGSQVQRDCQTAAGGEMIWVKSGPRRGTRKQAIDYTAELCAGMPNILLLIFITILQHLGFH